MDNEAPKYASWVPQAGGYVANGKVVSKSPIYDEAGKLKLDVDTSVFGITQPQNSVATPKVQPQVANNPLSNNGITTANTEGSGTDSNSLMTGAGSLGSLNNNTENTIFGPTNTPATKSNIAKEPILSPVDEVMRELQESIARGNDYQQQINLYTKLQNLTGEDYSAEIQSLTKQRQQKIENIDNNYSSQISTAMMRGDTDEVARLRDEQSNWRNSVGYQDAMAQKFQTAREEIDAEYVPTFWAGIQDIAGQIIQALPGVLNFQYNPYTDPALQMAQGYATSRVKEQMNSTGMYYSSMTQNAITKAVAELVPVYEKMAKEEAIQNFQLLQQTASFLVDLEQTQFNLWKGQLDMKFQANADKRAEVAAAWDKVNQLGYVDNESSAILDIPAGTESYATRKAYVDKLNEIDKEKRKLDQDKALSDYKHGLDLEKMEAQSILDMQEYEQKAATDYRYDVALENLKYNHNVNLQNIKDANSGNNNKGGMTADELVEYYNNLAKLGYGAEQIRERLLDEAKNSSAFNMAWSRIASGNTQTPEDEKANANYGNLSEGAKKNISSQSLKSSLNTLIGDGFNGTTYQRKINDWVGSFSGSDVDLAINELVQNDVYDILNENKTKYGKNYKSTKEGFDNSLNAVNEFASMLYGTDWAKKESGAFSLYKEMIDDIDNTNDFDLSGWALMFDNDQKQEEGKKQILESIGENSTLGGKSGTLYKMVNDYIKTGKVEKPSTSNAKPNTNIKMNTDFTGAATNAKQKAAEAMKEKLSKR